MPAEYSRELFAMKHYTSVPGTPPFVMGVTSVHGEVLSLVDLGLFFGQPSLALTNLNKVVVVESGNLNFGIVIDEPLGIKRIPLDELEDPPFGASDSRTPFITGVSGEHEIILDMAALLASKQLIIGGGGTQSTRAGDGT